MADDAPTASDRPRSTFGPAVIGGLAGGALAAVAGNQDWVSVSGGDAAFAGTAGAGADLTAPPVTATALVLLATWGVVLVSRGRVRRGVAWLDLLAALAVTAFAVGAWIERPGEVADTLRSLDVSTGRTAWSYLGVVGGLLGLVTSVTAVRRVGGWPEMGRRYDAPGGEEAPRPATPIEEQSSLDLWKALDEGRDPTDDPRG